MKTKRKAKTARRRRVSMRGGGRRADCLYQCPVKGVQDFGAWLRKGETANDACLRELKRRVDEAQVPLCKKIRVRIVD